MRVAIEKEDLEELQSKLAILLGRERELIETVVSLREAYASVCKQADIEPTVTKAFTQALKYEAPILD